jgi:hypothetical protein
MICRNVFIMIISGLLTTMNVFVDKRDEDKRYIHDIVNDRLDVFINGYSHE